MGIVRDPVRQSRHRRRLRVIRDSKARAAGPPGDPTFWHSPSFLLGQNQFREPYANHPWVYRAASVISRNLTAVPLRFFSGDMDEPTPVTSGPWVELFEDINPEMHPGEFWQRSWLHIFLGGEVFWVLLAKDGRPVQTPREIPRWMWPYPGGLFEPIVNDGGMLVGWKWNRGGKIVELALHQVMQQRLPNPYDERRGLAPMGAATRSARTDAKASVHNEAMLDNGMRPSGVFSTESMLTDDQKKFIKEQASDEHGGYAKAGKNLFLDGGLKWQQMGLTAKDMEYGAQKEWSKKEIAAVFGVPMMFMGDMDEIHSKESSRTVERVFWETELVPHLTNTAEPSIATQLMRGRGTDGTWAAFDTSGIKALQREEKEKRDLVQMDTKIGVPPEVAFAHHQIEYEPIAGLDVGMVDMNRVPLLLATVEEEPEPEPAPAPPPPTPPEADAEEEGEEEEDRTLTKSSERQVRASRLVLWHGYIRAVQGPGEKRMRAGYARWLRTVRAETLEFVRVGARVVRELSPDEVDIFLQTHASEWEKALVAKTQPAVDWIVGKSLDRLDGQIGGLSTASKSHPRMLAFMEQYGTRKVKLDVIATMQKLLKSQLLEGIANGESVAQLQGRVRLVSNATSAQSLRFARTETGGAATGSRFEAYQLEGVEKHSWLTAGDEHVRETHMIDGEVQVVGAEFSNGLRYPLDTEGAASEVINCRCDTLPE